MDEVSKSEQSLDSASTGEERRPYRMPSRPMGLRPGVDLTKALQMAAELEDEEILRKLRSRA